MPTPQNQNLRSVIELAEAMLKLADEGDAARTDPSCGILYGVMRDAGYRLRRLATQECEQHQQGGKWD